VIVKGQKINNRYEVIKEIGEGGMANVYLGKDLILERNVAIKVLRGDLANDEKFVRRFQREALSASSLSHANIVEIYDVGEDDGDYFIVMEYVPGKNLKQLLKKRGNLTVEEVVDIMLQITSAMGLAHDSLIIHRDLKPQNILIKDDGGIKITDFGIAMALNATQLTQTNSAMGSVHYFPPEQANGKGSTLKSDVYSLGIMMFELLTGTLPFRGDNAVEIALKHLKEPIPYVKDLIPNIPQSIENIIITATAKNPKNRYNNAHEMHEDLKTALNKERLKEPRRKLKYSEGISEELEYIDKSADMDNSIVKEIKDESEEKDKKKMILLASCFGVLFLGLIFFFFILPKLTSVPDVTIPDVSKLTVAEAEKKLESEGLVVAKDTIKKTSDTIEEGKVINTEPSIGRTIKEGTTITIIESIGEDSYEITDLTGKNYKEEKGKLEAHGIIVTIEEKEVATNEDETIDLEKIVGQDINAGVKLKSGDKITLYIPKQVEKYPNIVEEGWSIQEVQDWAKKKELNLTITYLETSDYKPGTIISQSRNTNSVIVAGASFEITVAKARVEVPSTSPESPDDSENKDQTDANATGDTE